MELQHIKLEQLNTTNLNVRKKGAKTVGDLLPSIRSLGVLQPLLVRKNSEGYEIIAGQRRYHAVCKLAEDGNIDLLPCIIMKEGDDAKAIEASLAENIARLPMDEIDQAKERYIAAGWQDVVILEIGAYWSSWEYGETPKIKGGKIFVQIANDGEVTFNEGYLTQKDAKQLQNASNGAEAEKSVERPELTKVMQNYLALHRHAAVRCELLDHAGIALRLAVAQIIAGSELWTIHAAPQKANSEAIGESLATNKAEDKFAKERNTIRTLLGTTDIADDTFVPRKDDWDKSHDLYVVFAKLTNLSDEEVTAVLTLLWQKLFQQEAQ